MFQLDDILRCWRFVLLMICLSATGAFASTNEDFAGTPWEWLFDADLTPGALGSRQSDSVSEDLVIFDEGIGWATSKAATDETLRRISAAGFNVYVPIVWHGRGVYFRSSVAHVEPRLAAVVREYDPLEYLVLRAHALGIRVVPWFTVTLREDARRPDLYDSGAPMNAYDIHSSKFRQFMISLMTEAVQKYDVDGINLDYVRTMGVCVSDRCAADYAAATNGNLLIDYGVRRVNEAAQARLRRWQGDAVDDLVRTFSDQARQLRSGLSIAADIHSQTDSDRMSLEGRDPARWLERGWVDRVFDMQYGTKVDLDWIERFRATLPDPRSLVVLFSNYEDRNGAAVPRPAAVVSRLAQLGQAKWGQAGVGFYLYSMLSDEQIRMLASGPFVRAPARAQAPSAQ
jgi:uncharacterized lipoprotein YddW (UPF0748 family)